MNEIEQGKSAKLRMKSSVIKTNEGKMLKEREREKTAWKHFEENACIQADSKQNKILISSAKSQKSIKDIV